MIFNRYSVTNLTQISESVASLFALAVDGGALVTPGGLPDIMRRIGIEDRDAGTHHNVRPDAGPKRRDTGGCNDGDIRQRIVAGRQKSRARQAACRVAHPREEECTSRVDDERGKAGEREGRSLGRMRNCRRKFMNERYDHGRGGQQQDARKGEAEARPNERRKAQRAEHQNTHRRIFEKIDAVGKKRDGADLRCDGEFDEEKRNVQRNDEPQRPAQPLIVALRGRTHCRWSALRNSAFAAARSA